MTVTPPPGGRRRFRRWDADGPVRVSGVFRVGPERTALRTVEVGTQLEYSRIGHFWAAWRAYERREIDADEFGERVRRLGQVAGLRFEDDAEIVLAVMQLVAPEDLVFEAYTGDEAAG